jgi:hypothetical protein
MEINFGIKMENFIEMMVQLLKEKMEIKNGG